MSEADGTVYTARQVSEALAVSTAMVRKYAATLEAITGEPVKQHPRDGRLYTREQLDALVTAKGFVGGNAGMSVDTALRIALGRAESAVKEPQAQPTDINTVAFAEAILAELRGLRLTNERLLERLEALENRQLPSPERTEPVVSESTAASGVRPDDSRPGVLVRAAQRLERLLRLK